MARTPMQDYFFMREGIDTFRLEPEKHSRYVFGERDQRQRDRLLESLEETAYSRDGYKATIYGDYGRGKTHLCLNLIFEIKRRSLPFEPVYVKCGAFKKKEPFSSLFREMVFHHTSARLQGVTMDYQRKVQSGEAPSLNEFVPSEDVALVISQGLTVPNPGAVKQSMRWLGGEAQVDLTMLGGSLKKQLADPSDFGAVLRGMSQLFIAAEDRVPLYIIDEAERFENIADTDTYFTWLAAIRELAEISGIGLIFMVGAKSRDRLPALFLQEEISRRIGVANYIELLNPGMEAIRLFLLEQLQTSIKKGAVPIAQKEVVTPEALDETVPPELLEIIGNSPERLETFPFEPDAFEEFVQRIASGERANKPSEAQLRLQRAAQRAIRLNRRTITAQIVGDIHEEAY